jgi:hypothetical protein
MPALLTRMSTFRKASSAALAMASQDARPSPVLPWMATACRPMAVISRTTPSARSAFSR